MDALHIRIRQDPHLTKWLPSECWGATCSQHTMSQQLTFFVMLPLSCSVVEVMCLQHVPAHSNEWWQRHRGYLSTYA